MNRLAARDYPASTRYIDPSGCGVVYPYSIAEGTQRGDIFTGPRSALFWHDSGFAVVYGAHDEDLLDWIYETFLSVRSAAPRRFVLFVSEESVKEYFAKKGNLLVERRLFFAYRGDLSRDILPLPAGYRLCEIDRELLGKLHGRITPSFSWSSTDAFLQKGKGYCILAGEAVVAWAFTAAVSKEEIDIGAETCSGCQRLGLGAAVADRMVRYSREQGKRPVWACHSGNIASQALARRLGFVVSAECYTIKKK